MRFDEFERRARAEWERIPEAYKAGIDGLRVERDARAHDELHDVYTLGECVTEAYPSDYGGPDTIRSAVVLYYGSFLRVSRRDPDFDWAAEIWETLTHELQHHLESLAADERLLDLDYAMDENFKRLEGQPFDTSFYRAGLALGDGWYGVEDEYFHETFDAALVMHFEWAGARYEVPVPPASADVTFLRVVDGVADAPRELYVVVRRRRGWRDTLRALLRRAAPTVAEHEVSAVRVPLPGRTV